MSALHLPCHHQKDFGSWGQPPPPKKKKKQQQKTLTIQHFCVNERAVNRHFSIRKIFKITVIFVSKFASSFVKVKEGTLGSGSNIFSKKELRLGAGNKRFR